MTCPANKTVASSNGFPVSINYTVTTSGGAAPVTVTGNPPSGSNFPVGSTIVRVTANSSDGQTAELHVHGDGHLYAAKPATGNIRAPNVLPVGGLDIEAGQKSRQPWTTTSPPRRSASRPVCHSITASIIPKSGDVFVGEYGAILDKSR